MFNINKYLYYLAYNSFVIHQQFHSKHFFQMYPFVNRMFLNFFYWQVSKMCLIHSIKINFQCDNYSITCSFEETEKKDYLMTEYQNMMKYVALQS